MKKVGLILALATAPLSAATTEAIASAADTTTEAESSAAISRRIRKKSLTRSSLHRKLGKSSKSSTSSSSSDAKEGWYYYGGGGHHDGWNGWNGLPPPPTWDSRWGNSWSGDWSNGRNHPTSSTFSASSSLSSSFSGKSGKSSSKTSKSSKSCSGKSGKHSKSSSNCEETPLIPIHTTIDFLLIQDHFRTSPKDIHQFTNVVYQFLLDNVGSIDTFFVDSVRVVDEGRGSNGNSGDVESISFRADIDFLAVESFVEWVDNGEPGKFQNNDDALHYYNDDGDHSNYGYGHNEVGEKRTMKNNHLLLQHHGDRHLQTGQCSGASKVACCANNSFNNGKPSRDCRRKGCTLQRCRGRRRQRMGRMLHHGDGYYGSSHNNYYNNNGSNHEFPDLFEVDFTKGIQRYTSNFRPAEATSILGAEDIDAVAICGAFRYGFENEGDSFPCPVYKKEECRDNEDLIFDKKEDVCDAGNGKWHNDGHDD